MFLLQAVHSWWCFRSVLPLQCDRQDQSLVVSPWSELLTSQLYGKGSDFRMFVHLLLNTAHRGSCCAGSSVSGLLCSDLWEDTGQSNSQGFTFSREGAEGYSFQALLKEEEFCRAAVPRGVSWALFLCWMLSAHNKGWSIHCSLIKSAHKKWLAEISIKNMLVRRKKVFDFFFFFKL